MRKLTFTIRRKFLNPATNEKQNYGNVEEEVTSGPDKGKKVPAIQIDYEMAPESVEELLQNLGGDSNFDKFVDSIFTGALKDGIRTEVFAKAEDTEQTEEGRKSVLNKIAAYAKSFTFKAALAETVTAKVALDDISSPEMQSLMESDPVEFALRVKEILKNTRGVKAA